MYLIILTKKIDINANHMHIFSLSTHTIQGN